MKKIAFIGATGMLGQPVAHAFIQRGFAVTMLVRDVNKARTIFGPNVHLIQGDVHSTEDLQKLMNGQQFLYLNLSVKPESGIKDFQPEREGLKNILAVGKDAGIQRIGYLSSLVQFYTDSNWWVLDLKKEAVRLIQNSGMNYSIFYPSTFMESFDKGAYRQGNTINLAGKSKYPLYLIAGSDYGNMVVQAFENNHGNNDYIVQGHDGYIADDAARLFVREYKRGKVRIMKVPMGLLEFLGNFSRKIHYGANIVDILNNYPEKFQSEQTWKELGEPKVRFVEYIKRA